MCQHNKQFDAWWAEQVGNGGTWTMLERLAAKDAWEAATKAASPAPSQPEPGEGAMPPLEHVRGYVQSELWKGSISGASGPIVELAYKFIQGNLQQPKPVSGDAVECIAHCPEFRCVNGFDGLCGDAPCKLSRGKQ